jgi:ComF family protein
VLKRALAHLPGQCELCRRWGSARLCGDCLARFAAPVPRCGCCALPLALQAPACGECLREPPPFERTVCAVDYVFPWDHLIREFKFHGQTELAGPLALRLAAAVQRQGDNAVQCVLPVPMNDQRLRERGYDQAWELARRVATALRLPARADALVRTLNTAHQTELGRSARQRNLRAAFFVPGAQRAALQNTRVALVDDVMTTGATLREAAAALKRAGVAAVDAWVLARTPAPGAG